VTSRRRLTDSDVEALMSGHTPPERPDLAATAAFLRELPAQLSESEPIELAAPPRRRTRLLVAVAASVAAVVGFSGVLALRGGDEVRPAVGGEAPAEVATTNVSPSSGLSANAVDPATTVQPGVLTAPLPGVPSDSTSTSAFTDPQSPAARYAAAVLAWNQCVTVKGEVACGAKPDPGAYGLETTTPTTNAVNGLTPTSVLEPSSRESAGSSTCNGKTDRPGLEHPDVLTC
jgi:hypothetical protein